MYTNIDDLNKLFEATKGAMSDKEKKILGIDGDRNAPEKRLFEQGFLAEAVQPLQGKEADSGVAFYFEYAEDAQALYDAVLEMGDVFPGEIKIKHVEGQHIVIFAAGVTVNKPEVIQGAMLAFDDLMAEDKLNIVGLDGLHERSTK